MNVIASIEFVPGDTDADLAIYGAKHILLVPK